MLDIVNSQFVQYPNGAGATASWPITLDFVPTPGNAILVFAGYGKGTGSGATNLTISDNAGHTYALCGSSQNTVTLSYAAKAFLVGVILNPITQITLASTTAGALTVEIIEIQNEPDSALSLDWNSPVISTTPDVINEAPSSVGDGILHDDELLFVCATRVRGTAVVGTPVVGTSVVNNSGGADVHPLYVCMLGDVDTDDADPQIGFTLASSAAYKGTSFTVYSVAIVAAQVIPNASTAPDYILDVRDIDGVIDGAAITSMSEHNGGSTATLAGAVVSDTGGINSSRCVTVTAGSISIPYAGAIGTVAICAQVASDATIVSGDSVAHPAAGALQMKLTGTNVSAQVTTTSGGTDGKVTDGSGKTGMPIPVVYICTFDNGTARLTVNGFSYTAAYVGTPNVATVLNLFGTYASGSVTAGSGSFYRLEIYATPQNAGQEAQITRQCSWMYEVINKRVGIVTHDSASSLPYRAQSDDGITWTDVERISFIAPLAGLSRDWSYEGQSASVHYFCFTENNFTTFGTTFGRAKTKDFRLFIPAASVDCSAEPTIDGVTRSPWGPMPVFQNGVLIGYKVTKSNTVSEYYSPVTNWPAAPTFSSPTVLSGNNGDQVTIIPPSERGNPSPTLYRIYEPVGKYRTATAITGTYGSEVTLAGGIAGEGAFCLALDSRFIFYNPSNSGWIGWESSDNGTTFGSVQTVQGLGIATGGPVDLGQGQMFDFLGHSYTQPVLAGSLQGSLRRGLLHGVLRR